MNDKRAVGGVLFSVAEPDEALNAIYESAMESHGAAVHLANAYSISQARKDPRLSEVFARSTFTFADSRWVSIVSKYLRGPDLPQVRGPSLFLDAFTHGQAELKHFLLGGPEEMVDKLEASLNRLGGTGAIVGKHCPPFRVPTEEERARQDAAIQSSGANLVWVGLGTPKQDFEVDRLARELGVTAVAVGAAFDFVAGTKRTAPDLVIRIGFEWMYRLLTEPRRLWRRYLFGNIGFLRAIMENR